VTVALIHRLPFTALAVLVLSTCMASGCRRSEQKTSCPILPTAAIRKILDVTSVVAEPSEITAPGLLCSYDVKGPGYDDASAPYTGSVELAIYEDNNTMAAGASELGEGEKHVRIEGADAAKLATEDPSAGPNEHGHRSYATLEFARADTLVEVSFAAPYGTSRGKQEEILRALAAVAVAHL
jgi:hypothetical protein